MGYKETIALKPVLVDYLLISRGGRDGRSFQSIEALVADETLTNLKSRIEPVLDDLQKNVLGLHKDVARIDATITATMSTARLITYGVSALFTVVLAIGAWKTFDNEQLARNVQDQLASQRVAFDELQKQGTAVANLMKDARIDQLDAIISSEGTLDGLSEAAISRINELSAEMRRLNSRLPDSDKSEYFRLADALLEFRGKHFDDALKTLDKINEGDRRHFGYAYLRGATFDRLIKPEEAYNWFETARHYGDETRTFMAINALAVADLTRWKHAPRQDPRLIDAVEKRLSDLTEVARRFPLAHFNLACIFSEKRDYSRATESLRKFVELEGDDGWKILVDFVQKDLTLKSDQFLSNYVREGLAINIETSDKLFGTELTDKVKRAITSMH